MCVQAAPEQASIATATIESARPVPGGLQSRTIRAGFLDVRAYAPNPASALIPRAQRGRDSQSTANGQVGAGRAVLGARTQQSVQRWRRGWVYAAGMASGAGSVRRRPCEAPPRARRAGDEQRYGDEARSAGADTDSVRGLGVRAGQGQG